ncbi:MAG: trehalose-6-phosphate synthase [Alphaproteobacteria bacterium]|nr:trehalose-6-phosphate synthase [Alphaproteobacteria bacterium]
MARLVIVSNRVAIPGDRALKAGGLAVARKESLGPTGGLWFGWSGQIVAKPPANPKRISAEGMDYAALDLSPEEHETYYAGFSNATLWPLFHYRLGLIDFRRAQLKGYLAVNARYAQALVELIRPDDTIWVHDYHFIPLAEMLRRLGVKNPIGFFLHIPFPAPEVLSALPGHEQLTHSLLAYDLVGFQTEIDRHAFERCVIEHGQGTLDETGRLVSGERRVTTGAYPVGIDVDEFAGWAEKNASSRETKNLVDSLSGRKLMIGVDRLDYSKGIPKRFEAFEELLGTWSKHRRNVTFLQVAPISRGEVAQYRSLRRELEALAGRINGKYAEVDWTPVRYINKPVARPTLAGFYRHARIGLVTPVRDGMNLVAKEYVAAQNPEDPGVLVLSHLAGAAHELQAALLVNPFDVESVAEAIHRGLVMPLEERRERWAEMRTVLGHTTQQDWTRRFLAALGAARETLPADAAA